MPTTANWTRMLPFGVANPFSNVTPNNGNFSIANAVYNFWNLSGIRAEWDISNYLDSNTSQSLGENVTVYAPKWKSPYFHGFTISPVYTPKNYNIGFGVDKHAEMDDGCFVNDAYIDNFETPFPYINDYSITVRGLKFKTSNRNGVGDWELVTDDITLDIFYSTGGFFVSVQYVTYPFLLPQPPFWPSATHPDPQYGHTIELTWKGQGFDKTITMYAWSNNGFGGYDIRDQVFNGTIDLTNEYFQYL